MNKKLRILTVMTFFVMTSSVMFAQPMQMQNAGAEATAFTPEVPAGPISLTLSQANNMINGSPSQEFEAAFSAYDTEAADDFIIPAGPSKVIVSVDIEGTGSPTFAGPADVIMNIYSDGGGLPGALVFSETFPAVAGASFTLNSTTCPPLDPGTYWMSIVQDRDFGAGGQWFWSTSSDDLTGNPWAVQNPGNGFGSGCTTWTSSALCTFGGGASGGTGLNYVINLADIEIVPTLGEWAIISLGLLLMIFGVVAVSQRQTALA